MSGGVTPAPAPTPAKISPLAMPRSWDGIQFATSRFDAGIHDGFADAEQETDPYQDAENAGDRRHHRGQGRKHRPPYGRHDQHPAWSEPVGEPPAGSLEQRVSCHERAEYPSQP